MAREFFAAYHSYLKTIEPLSDAERGRLFTACLSYSLSGTVPELRGNERFVWPSIQSQIDRDSEKYNRICEINSRNALHRYATADDRLRACTAKSKEKTTEKNIDEDDPHSSRAKLGVMIRVWIELFGQHPSKLQSDEIAGWLEVWDWELLQEAVKAAAEANAGNPIAYIRKTLADWKSRDITSIRVWADAEVKRDGLI